jgi:hypothetical protein
VHNIEYYVYTEKVDKKAVQEDLNDFVSRETWHEGGSGIDPIRWNDFVCKNREEAEEWIKNHDKGWYDQLAVKYYSPLPIRGKKADELEKKVKDSETAYYQKRNANYIKTRTSKFIGCWNCGSRMASAYLQGNFCPICRADLRPDTLLKSIAAAQNKFENAKRIRDEYADKHSKKEIYWLVKIEYHT